MSLNHVFNTDRGFTSGLKVGCDSVEVKTDDNKSVDYSIDGTPGENFSIVFKEAGTKELKFRDEDSIVPLDIPVLDIVSVNQPDSIIIQNITNGKVATLRKVNDLMVILQGSIVVEVQAGQSNRYITIEIKIDDDDYKHISAGDIGTVTGLTLSGKKLAGVVVLKNDTEKKSFVIAFSEENGVNFDATEPAYLSFNIMYQSALPPP
jgi:hypothetical protein